MCTLHASHFVFADVIFELPWLRALLQKRSGPSKGLKARANILPTHHFSQGE